MPNAVSPRFLRILFVLLLAGCGPQPVSPPKTSSPRTVARAESPPETKPPARAKSRDIPTLEISDEPEPPSKFRPRDQRPKHDDAQLAAAGIQVFESKRLKLYTDIDSKIAATLPPLADQLYDALVDYFGPLPPDEAGGEFQMTGYLIHDEALFREHNLLEGLPLLMHGKHLQNRFWMRDQQFDYYRRHLLFHECTHCYMTFVPGPVPPVWYMEGMAEVFATHRIKADGKVEFRILPTTADEMGGWGRIEAVHQECTDGRPLSVGGVYELPHNAFFKPQAYAWSWALCHFFDSHPKYGERFRSLGQHLHDGEFAAKFREAFQPEQRNVSTEWTLFESQLQPGYDTTRAAIDFVPAKSGTDDAPRKAMIRAARGWQDVGVHVSAGDVVSIAASGQFTLARDPKPWISEPQGISFRYFNGLPLGRLVCCLDADPNEDRNAAAAAHLLQVMSIGKSAELTMPTAGRLLFRVNDAWDSLADNEGTVEVAIRRETLATP